MTRCSWPVKGPGHKVECGRQAVECIESDRDRWPRCRRHATREAHELAAARGYRIEAVTA